MRIDALSLAAMICLLGLIGTAFGVLDLFVVEHEVPTELQRGVGIMKAD